MIVIVVIEVVVVSASVVVVVVKALVWTGPVVDVWAGVVRGGARADMVVINALDMEAIGCEFTVPVIS